MGILEGILARNTERNVSWEYWKEYRLGMLEGMAAGNAGRNIS